MPQLRDHLSEEIERNLEEAEPAIRSELEQLVIARATDEHAKISVALTAKIDELAKALEITTAAKYSVLMAERAENVNLLAKAEARIEDAASMMSHAVKEIVTDELSRFPRAGEIDQLRKEFAEPRGLNPRGRWMPDETYQRLDLVTINGDSFVSNIDGNRERPSRTAGDWTLSAARGNGGGGGGVTTMTDLVPVPSNGQLLIGNGSAFVNSTLTAGTGISISNGAGSITINATDGNITLDDGTAAAPSLNFTNEPTTGLFRASANVMGFAVAGVSRATMTTTGVTVTGTITPTGSVHAAAGSVGNPSLAFDADQDTGLFRIGANNLGVAAGGAKVLDVATTGLGITGTLSVSGVATLGAGAILNTPASGTATNLTGLPISTGVSGLGTNVAAFLATPSSANLAAALTDETGTGALVFGTSPTLTTPISASLTSPALTDLTLAGGSSGASLVLGQGANGIATLTPAGTGYVRVNRQLWALSTTSATGIGDIETNANSHLSGGGGALGFWFAHDSVSNRPLAQSVSSGTAFSMLLQPYGGNVLIGTTSETGLTGGGGLKINSSTAGSAGAGALVVTGGLATGAASYFGGAVTAGGTVSANSGIYPYSAGNGSGLITQNGAAGGLYFANQGISTNMRFLVTDGAAASVLALTLSAGTGAATFAGAVTATDITIGAGNAYYSQFVVGVSDQWRLGAGINSGGNNNFVIRDSTAGVNALIISSTGLAVTGTLSTTGAATFAGAVTIGNTVNTVSPTSPNRTITMVVNGVTLYLAAKTTND